MMDDSAAAIAINRTSIGSNLSNTISSFSTSSNPNDTDTLCLVENESIVVYKERTDLWNRKRKKCEKVESKEDDDKEESY